MHTEVPFNFSGSLQVSLVQQSLFQKHTDLTSDLL